MFFILKIHTCCAWLFLCVYFYLGEYVVVCALGDLLSAQGVVFPSRCMSACVSCIELCNKLAVLEVWLFIDLTGFQ